MPTVTEKEGEYFAVGFRLVRRGILSIVEAFTEPHHSNILERLKDLAPHMRLTEQQPLFRARCALETGEVGAVGPRPDEETRERIRELAREGAAEMAAYRQVLQERQPLLHATLEEQFEKINRPVPLRKPVNVRFDRHVCQDLASLGNVTFTTIIRLPDGAVLVQTHAPEDTGACSAWKSRQFEHAVYATFQQILAKRGLIDYV